MAPPSYPPPVRATYRPPRTPPSQRSFVVARKHRPFHAKPVPYFDESLAMSTAALPLNIPASSALTIEGKIYAELTLQDRLRRESGHRSPREAALLRHAPPPPDRPLPTSSLDILRSDVAHEVVEHERRLQRARQHLVELQKRVDGASTSVGGITKAVFPAAASRPPSPPAEDEYQDSGYGFSKEELALDLSFLEEEENERNGVVYPCDDRIDSPLPWESCTELSPPSTPPTPPTKEFSREPLFLPAAKPSRIPKGFSKEELSIDLSFLDEEDGKASAVQEFCNAAEDSPKGFDKEEIALDLKFSRIPKGFTKEELCIDLSFLEEEDAKDTAVQEFCTSAADSPKGFDKEELTLDLGFLEEEDSGKKRVVYPFDGRVDSHVPWESHTQLSPPPTPPTPPPKEFSRAPLFLPAAKPSRIPKGFTKEELSIDLSFLDEEDGKDTAVQEFCNDAEDSPKGFDKEELRLDLGFLDEEHSVKKREVHQFDGRVDSHVPRATHVTLSPPLTPPTPPPREFSRTPLFLPAAKPSRIPKGFTKEELSIDLSFLDEEDGKEFCNSAADSPKGFDKEELRLDLGFLDEEDSVETREVYPSDGRGDSPVLREASRVPLFLPAAKPSRIPKGFTREELCIDLSFLDEEDGKDTAVQESCNKALPLTPPCAPKSSPVEVTSPLALQTALPEATPPPPSPETASPLPTPPWKHLSQSDVTVHPGSPAKRTPPKLPSALMTPQMRSAITSGKKVMRKLEPDKKAPKKALRVVYKGQTKETPVATTSTPRLVKKAEGGQVAKADRSKIQCPVKAFKPKTQPEESIKSSRSRVAELLMIRHPNPAPRIPVRTSVPVKPTNKSAIDSKTQYNSDQASKKVSKVKQARSKSSKPPPPAPPDLHPPKAAVKVTEVKVSKTKSSPPGFFLTQRNSTPSYSTNESQSGSACSLPRIIGAAQAKKKTKVMRKSVSDPQASDPYRRPNVTSQSGKVSKPKVNIPPPQAKAKSEKPLAAKQRKFKVSKGIN